MNPPSPGSGALHRVTALLRARVASQREGRAVPVAALVMQAFIAGVLCGLVRDGLAPFAYGVFALSVCAALVAVPLLGELSGLLTADEADEWVRALPATPFELGLARMLHLLIALGTLTLGAAVPAALLASVPWEGRLLLLACALGQALFVAAALLTVQTLLRGRAQAPLMIAQTLLFMLVVVGSTLGLRYVAAMADWHGPADGPDGLAWFPPAWFAAPLAGLDPASTPVALPWRLAAPLAALAAALALLLLPSPPRETARGGQPLLSLALAPVRWLATRLWVTPGERGAFDLVYDALPKEREFVLRTYPLVAVPLAFLVVDPQMLPVLVFTPGVWLPILLIHVPASGSHQARWLLETSPAAPRSVAGGALKAVVVRFVVPLFALIAVVAAAIGGPAFALRMVPSGFLVAVLVVRSTWDRCVADPPLSVAPDELAVPHDLLTVLGTLALVLSFVSLAALMLLDDTPAAVAAPLVLLVLELALDRKWRHGDSPAPARAA